MTTTKFDRIEIANLKNDADRLLATGAAKTEQKSIELALSIYARNYPANAKRFATILK